MDGRRAFRKTMLALLLASSSASFSPTAQRLRTSVKAARPLLDNGGWLFHYADTRPYTLETPEAQAFVATNVAFTIAGAAIATTGGDLALGALTEAAGIASVGYHASQCHLGGTNRTVVQFFMLIDYALALPTLAGGAFYASGLGDALPQGAIVCAILSGAALVGGWFFESPRQYMLLHGLWHVFGAAAAYQLAIAGGSLT